jgi:hypothetical protein
MVGGPMLSELGQILMGVKLDTLSQIWGEIWQTKIKLEKRITKTQNGVKKWNTFIL